MEILIIGSFICFAIFVVYRIISNIISGNSDDSDDDYWIWYMMEEERRR
ncbi:hypothetical protein AAX27_02005 [Aliarcobacter thereius]|nr:hypothetical protein AAX27_02005 [Aliarcobacter thereius]